MSSSGVEAAGQKPTTASARSQPLVDDAPQHRLGVGEEVARGRDPTTGSERMSG